MLLGEAFGSGMRRCDVMEVRISIGTTRKGGGRVSIAVWDTMYGVPCALGT